MAMRAPTSTSDPLPEHVIKQIQASNPMRQRAIEASRAHHPNSRPSMIHRLHQEIADLPTREMAAIKPTHLIPLGLPKTTRPMLKTDSQGRPYLKLTDPIADTLLLVQRAVSEFYAFEECFPDEIVLSPLHYFTFGMKWRVFYVPNTQYQIPYTYEGVVAYHVMARGASIYNQR